MKNQERKDLFVIRINAAGSYLTEITNSNFSSTLDKSKAMEFNAFKNAKAVLSELRTKHNSHDCKIERI